MAQTGTDNELTTRQRRAIAALLTERNVSAAAQAANVGVRTLYTWLAEPAFRLAVREAESTAIDAAARRLVGLADGALSVLAAMLTDNDTAPALKLRAAQTILDHLLELRELATLESRVAALEAGRHDDRTT